MNNEKSLVNALIDMSKPKAHDNINSLIQNNQNMTEQKIGPIPDINDRINASLANSGLSQQDLLEMIMPFGGAAGMLNKIGAGIKHSSAVPKTIDKAGGFLENLTRLLPKNLKHLYRLSSHVIHSPIKYEKNLTGAFKDMYTRGSESEKLLFSLLDDAKKYRTAMFKFAKDARLNQVGEFLKKYMPFD